MSESDLYKEVMLWTKEGFSFLLAADRWWKHRLKWECIFERPESCGRPTVQVYGVSRLQVLRKALKELPRIIAKDKIYTAHRYRWDPRRKRWQKKNTQGFWRYDK